MSFNMGIDIGSTTAKVVVINQDKKIVFSAYNRHHTETLRTLQGILLSAKKSLGNVPVSMLITGSAGLGISEAFHLPFIQEVIASSEVVNQHYPSVKTLIDIGGEDAKMIFFNPEKKPDIRMNGSCAGGTGAFLDEMATLMCLSIKELDGLASKYTRIYPMASRCGVFAKTDVQNLLSKEIPREDIAASIFNAIVFQTLATLGRGYNPSAKMIFSGGPLTFLPSLRKAFERVLQLSNEDVCLVEHAELLPAMGGALAVSEKREVFEIDKLIEILDSKRSTRVASPNRLLPLFSGEEEFQKWQGAHNQHKTRRTNLRSLSGKKCFLGIDSGSTTTKIVLVDSEDRLAFKYYCNNNGNPIQAVQIGLEKIRETFWDMHPPPVIGCSVVTGYGEDLIRAAFGIDVGMVETLAHYQAAKILDKNVTFILDIGGQDMKAIFVKDGYIQNIEINEACSSGCGSFIESFANSLGYKAAEFSMKACQSVSPCDLGTRCTVFMNSKVKQALREGAGIEDISAGLAYSVIKNALHKVLKVTNIDLLGDHIVVQGGAFRNPAILKAIENLLGKSVLRPDIAELMGAYGAAITARDVYFKNGKNSSSFVDLNSLDAASHYDRKNINCRGCENRCMVTKLIFENRNVFYTGNRCENVYSNSGIKKQKGSNLTKIKYEMLFNRDTKPKNTPLLTLGIPRVLGMYETYPFWNSLFIESGIQVVLSDPSSKSQYDRGAGTIMSENICYPAKLVHGHIYELIEARVDRIFYPMIFYENSGFPNAANSFVCPIVSGYSDVIKSAIDPDGKHGIPLDSPSINFQDEKLLKKACYKYLTSLGVSRSTFQKAFYTALSTQIQYRNAVKAAGNEILTRARSQNRQVVLILGRPYHIDPRINHKVPDILTNFGIDVITEDAVPKNLEQNLPPLQALTQWEYINRIYHAAHWAARKKDVDIVQLNSFGCGPDSFVVDEVKGLLGEFKRNHTVIRVDEVESMGSVKLRLRSMVEAKAPSLEPKASMPVRRKNTKVFDKEDKKRTLLVPPFANFCTSPLVRPAKDLGYQVEVLQPSDRSSVDIGLKFVNNEICYPGIILIGDVLKALQSGNYDPKDVAVALWETGGQCRASCIFTACKKAMVAAGFETIPLVTVSTNMNSTNHQPGFDIDVKKYIYKGVLGMAYTDALSALYYATAIRESNRGEAKKLIDHYLMLLDNGSLKLRQKNLLQKLQEAVNAFNKIRTHDIDYPKVGIVGEIYVKYNAFSNNRVAPWLMDQGIEVVMPPLLEFFTCWFVSVKAQAEGYMINPNFLWLISGGLNRYLQFYLNDIEHIMKNFRYYRPQHTIQHIAQKAEKILSLTHQYGESWLIAGSISSFVDDGIKNVLCLQPFGCIANHIIAKGVEKKLKQTYPNLNLLMLDSDAGTSEANFFNRMHFFINQSKCRKNANQENFQTA